jgi:hypothetical protein
MVQPPTPEEISRFDYGPRPTNYESVLKEKYFNNSLHDPFSAQYRFREPKKYWTKNLSGLYVGWLVIVECNAKNQFGAYTGWQPRAFIMRGDEIVTMVSLIDLHQQGLL